MQAVILAGGEGSRLRPLTYKIPKPLLPVGDKPILEIIIEGLSKCGFKDIILNVRYMAEHIQAYFRKGERLNVKIRYVKDDIPLGTAGPIRLSKNLLDGDPFIAMNGDLLTDMDFREMYDMHMQKGAEFTMAVKEHTFTLPYGVVEKNGDKVLLKEKPELSFHINAGIYVLSPEIVDLIPEHKPFDMTNLIQELLDQNRKIELYQIKGEWHDIGTMADYLKVNEQNGRRNILDDILFVDKGLLSINIL